MQSCGSAELRPLYIIDKLCVCCSMCGMIQRYIWHSIYFVEILALWPDGLFPQDPDIAELLYLKISR